MQTFSGLLIMLGLGVLGYSVWEFFTGVADAWATFVAGLLFAGVGVWLAGRVPAPAAPAAAQDAGTPEPNSVEAQPETEEAWFSIIESVEERVLDRIERLVEKHPRVTAVVAESGRYYSVPDGDDLPEWFALRVRCRRDERDTVMEEVGELIAAELGEEARSRVRIDYY